MDAGGAWSPSVHPPSQVPRWSGPVRRRAGEIGRASIIGLLLAGVIGAAVGIGWIETRAYLGIAPAATAAEPVPPTASLFVGIPPAADASLRAAPRVASGAEPVERGAPPVPIVAAPRAGWEGRADHFGAGMALANP